MSASAAIGSFILGTAGHIDHGKTSLVRALTGIDTDRLPEEKSRGITIDIGFANLDLGDLHLGIVDVPGHERFVRNMLAGAVGIDVAMLVIAADDSLMPQTREHLSILRMLDIEHGLIALTKTDLVEPEWLAMVEQDIRDFVKGTFLESAPIVRTAAAPGRPAAGCEELKRALRSVCARIEPRPAAGLFRLPVDRSFSVRGVGTIVTGTVWSGRLAAGDEVEWLPRQAPLRVRGVQSHGHDQAAVSRGQRAAANLIGVHHEEIQRGHELATPGYLKPSHRLMVELSVLDDSPFPIKHRGRYRLHLGTQELMARVSLLEGTLAAPGGQALAQLHCAEPAIASCGQPLVLRLESPLVTVGGGHVLQPAPKRMGRRARRAADRLEQLLMLRSKDPVHRAAAAIWFFGAGPWSTLDLCRDANLRPDQAAAVAEQLRHDGITVDVPVAAGRRTIHREVLANLERAAIDALEALHAGSPLASAMARPMLAASLHRLAEPALVNAILDRLLQHGRIGGNDQAVMLIRHAPTLTPRQASLRERILSTYAAAGLAPPMAGDLPAALGAAAGDVRQLLNLCVAQQLLVHLGSGLYLTTEAESAMRGKAVAALRNCPAGVTMSQLREALGTSRKYAVPFGEYLDRVGVTRRRGDIRVPGDGR